MTVPDVDALGPAPANPGMIATADDPGAPVNPLGDASPPLNVETAPNWSVIRNIALKLYPGRCTRRAGRKAHYGLQVALL